MHVCPLPTGPSGWGGCGCTLVCVCGWGGGESVHLYLCLCLCFITVLVPLRAQGPSITSSQSGQEAPDNLVSPNQEKAGCHVGTEHLFHALHPCRFHMDPQTVPHRGHRPCLLPVSSGWDHECWLRLLPAGQHQGCRHRSEQGPELIPTAPPLWLRGH